jgi:hypothetical protein
MVEITIEVPLDGEMTVSVTGAKGRSCKELTRELEALGRVTSTEETREMYEREERVLNSNRR